VTLILYFLAFTRAGQGLTALVARVCIPCDGIKIPGKATVFHQAAPPFASAADSTRRWRHCSSTTASSCGRIVPPHPPGRSRVTPKQQHASRREAATANDGDLCASHLTIAALAA
jgi:hypothetical protein